MPALQGSLERSVTGLCQQVCPKCAEQLVHLRPDQQFAYPVPDLKHIPVLDLSRARVVIEGLARQGTVGGSGHPPYTPVLVRVSVEHKSVVI